MKSIWLAEYGNNKIRVENYWFKGEKLYVNDELQHETLSFFTTNLTGHITNDKGEKEGIKVNLSGWFSIGCRLFIDDKKVATKQIE
ncbi:MAG: hypothetical protein Q4G16_01910 [Cruoricaptor ignavus]|nr:hypothetical protein [Cruoricaptor ignavus]